MKREERDRREAEKKARLAAKGSIAEVDLPLNRDQLAWVFWALAGLFFFRQVFVPKVGTFDLWFFGMVLSAVCLVPMWLWVSGRVHGLPLWPIYCLGIIPPYCMQLINASETVKPYTPQEQLKAVLTMIGFVSLGTIIVHQLTNRAPNPRPFVRAFDLETCKPMLVAFVALGLAFSLSLDYLWQLGGGAVSAMRGVATSLSNLGIFGLCILWGRKKLKSAQIGLVILSLGLLFLQNASGLILAAIFGQVGLAVIAFILGRQKIPWAFLGTFFALIMILHAGKHQMRKEYWIEGLQGSNRVSWIEMPAFYAEWFAKGLRTLGSGGKTDEGEKVSSAAERGSMVHLLLMVQQKTPSEIPFLMGETYKYLPEMLVPRVFNKEKPVSHVGNMILSLHYGLLDYEGIFKTSIGFDPVVEGYANFGYLGVAGTAIAMGFLIGGITLFGCGAPILSYRFLLAVLVLAGLVGSNNTVGVTTTVIWQSFLALSAVALILMKKIPNPLYAKPEAFGKMGDGRSDMGRNDAGSVKREAAGEEKPKSENGNSEAAPVRHERPTRFVYGNKK
jgi:hypothetical protein